MQIHARSLLYVTGVVWLQQLFFYTEWVEIQSRWVMKLAVFAVCQCDASSESKDSTFGV